MAAARGALARECWAAKELAMTEACRKALGIWVLFAVAFCGATHAQRADKDDGDAEKGEFIPTGVRITPTAAKDSIFAPLNPDLPADRIFTVGQAVTTLLSPDGGTLLILTSGYNRHNFTSGPRAGKRDPAESAEYIFVFDVGGVKPVKKQVLKVPNAFDGLAFHPSGREFYVSGRSE